MTKEGRKRKNPYPQLTKFGRDRCPSIPCKEQPCSKKSRNCSEKGGGPGLGTHSGGSRCRQEGDGLHRTWTQGGELSMCLKH